MDSAPVVPIYGMTMKQRMQMQNNLMMKAVSDSRFLLYSGTSAGFQNKVQDVLRQPNSYTEAHITIAGEQVKQRNNCCMVVTIMLGVFFIIPCFMTCCDWWQKMVSAVFEVPHSAYQNLQAIMRMPEMTKFTLVISDSYFDSSKAKMLYDILSQSSIKEFTFINCVPILDHKNAEFSLFQFNMKPIKMLPIKSTISWANKTIE